MHSDSGDYTYPGAIRLVPAEPDTRTGPQRTADELAIMRSDLVMALATVQELNRRMAHVEVCVHRLMNADAQP